MHKDLMVKKDTLHARARVLVLSYEFPPLGGGGAKVVSSLVSSLIDTTYDIDVVTMWRWGLPRVEQNNNVTIYRVPAMRLRTSVCSALEMIPYLFSAWWKIRYLLSTYTYALIHVHFIFPDALVTYALRKYVTCPVIVTAHGSDVPGYNPNRFKLMHVVLLPLWRTIVHWITHITCPSHTLASLILLHDKSARVSVIPNGIDIHKFTPSTHEHKRILIVTRMFERKGVQYFLKAIAEIDHDWTIDIVGDGPYLEVLKQQAAQLQVPAIFHGFMDNTSHAFKSLFEEASVFVFPSVVENFPIVLLEAMTAGLAVITTKDTGCAEVVGPGGCLVPARDVIALRKALAELIESKEKRSALGAVMRRRVISEFSDLMVSEKYLRLYDAVLTAG